jgi:hypothetical protein
METYALYVEDDRYSIPTLVLVPAASDGRAKAKATELLLESPHHLSVEVSRNGITLFTVGDKRGRYDGSRDDQSQSPQP